MFDYNFANTKVRTGTIFELTTAAEHTATDRQVNELRDGIAKVTGDCPSASGNWLSQALKPTPGSKLDPSSSELDMRVRVKEFISLTESDRCCSCWVSLAPAVLHFSSPYQGKRRV
ncbi:hypothetical protein N7501_011132 [Penicillium viridicatum]|nr:hypothetical protein N7501_011132 [Penicillium viridicatum]